MPLFDYVCVRCDFCREKFFTSLKRAEEWESEDGRCEECGGKVKRIAYYSNGLNFKGSGWYVSDYKNKKG